MKALVKTSILFLVSCILLSACKKKELTHEEIVRSRNAGTASVSLNGKPWKNEFVLAQFELNNAAHFSFSMEVFEDGLQSQTLIFTGVNSTEPISKLYSLKEYNPKMAKAMFSNVSNDAAIDQYLVIEDSALKSYLKIDNYDPATSKVNGSFEIHMYKDFGATPGFPDTLHFTGGTFDFKISPATL